MFCISVSFRKTPVEIRQYFSFSAQEAVKLLQRLTGDERITGGIVVSTCNRSEIYFTGNRNAMQAVEYEIAADRGLQREDMRKYCLYYEDKLAIRHLYKVACGLDSMVLGEDEILRQVKEAYQESVDAKCSNGELNMIFQGAFNCAKLAKSNTKLSSTSVSIGTLTANAVEDWLLDEKVQETEGLKGDAGVQKPDREHAVLVIGATGKIGSIVAKDLLAKGIHVIGTSRSRITEREEMLPARGMEWIAFADRYRILDRVGAVVSATTSPHYTLTGREYREAVTKPAGKLLIDLAVPYDLDKELAACDGVVLRDIDYFRKLSKDNNEVKLGEAQKAKRILTDCVEDMMKKLALRSFREARKGVSEEKWFSKMVYYLKDVLDSDQFEAVLARIEESERED